MRYSRHGRRRRSVVRHLALGGLALIGVAVMGPRSAGAQEGVTVGLVLEYTRPEGENDHFVWYCDGCNELLHDVEFYLTDLATEIKPRFEEFYGSEELRTCKNCGTVKEVPQAPEF